MEESCTPLSKRSMTVRYSGALLLVAVFAAIGYLAFLRVVDVAGVDAAIINQSGRQRMLSQRIAVSALLLGAAADPTAADRARDLMQRTIREMESSHAAILDLLERSGQEDVLKDYRQPPLDLDAQVRDFLDLARQVAAGQAQAEDLESRLASALDRLLPKLEAAVSAHQKAGERRVGLLRTVSMASLAAILAVLFGTGHAIFRPMVEEVCRERETISALNRELQRQAVTDTLTGLRNRTGFAEIARRELELARRYGEPLAAVMFDIDHFKQVNDQHGHAAGDQVLAGLADLVRGNVRQTDHLFRWGGEEFLILCPRADAAEAAAVAEKLRGLAAGLEFPGGLRITVSFGVARLLSGESVEDLMRRADEALYAAKRGGRNRVEVHPGGGGHAG